MEIMDRFIFCLVVFVKLLNLQKLIVFYFLVCFINWLIFEIVLDEICSFLMSCDLIFFLVKLQILKYEMDLKFEKLISLLLGKLIIFFLFYSLNKYLHMRYYRGLLISLQKFLFYRVSKKIYFMICFMFQFLSLKFYLFWIN